MLQFEKFITIENEIYIEGQIWESAKLRVCKISNRRTIPKFLILEFRLFAKLKKKFEFQKFLIPKIPNISHLENSQNF